MNGTHFSPDDTPPPTAPRGQLTPPPRRPPAAVGAGTPEPPSTPHRPAPVPGRPFGYLLVKGLVRLAQRIGEALLGPEPKRLRHRSG